MLAVVECLIIAGVIGTLVMYGRRVRIVVLPPLNATMVRSALRDVGYVIGAVGCFAASAIAMGAAGTGPGGTAALVPLGASALFLCAGLTLAGLVARVLARMLVGVFREIRAGRPVRAPADGRRHPRV